MRKEYNKLVRDLIPSIIEAEGRNYSVVEMDATEYRQALLQKLVEEAREAQEAEGANLLIEIADLYEVIDAVLTDAGYSEDQAREIQIERRQKRGAFKNKTKLLWTD